MKPLSYILKKDSITVMLPDGPITILATNSQYVGVVQALTERNWERAVELCDLSISLQKAVRRHSRDLTVENGAVYYKGRNLRGYVVNRLLEFMNLGLPFAPLVKFIDLLLQNPSGESQDQLYKFLEYKDLPICKDGMVIAFKGVGADLYSVTGNKKTRVIQGTVDSVGRILNAIGAVIEVAREDVDDNKNVHCSQGLHVGSLDYARSFAEKVLVVKFNPKDAVSVPTDCQFQKLRLCKYEVVGELDSERALACEKQVFNYDKPAEAKPLKKKAEPKKEPVARKRGDLSKAKLLERVTAYIYKKKAEGETWISVGSVCNSLSPNYVSTEAMSRMLEEWGFELNQ